VIFLNNSKKCEYCRIPPLLDHHETSIVDSGYTGHFLLIIVPCCNKIKSRNPLRVIILSNGEKMDSTHTASLEIPELSEAASVAHVFSDMANNYLISVGQLCNEGYSLTFRIDGVAIYNLTRKAILKGQRDLGTGFCRINLRSDKPQLKIAEANNFYDLHSTGALVNYLHKAMFSPTKSALLQSVNKVHLTTWLGLTKDTINKHLKMTPATEMGHLNQKRQNICSTKNDFTFYLEDETVTPSSLRTKTNLVYAVAIEQGFLYTYLTGGFFIRSSKGNWYVMVCYSYDCNYVKLVPMKSRSASEWLKAYGGIHQELTSKGFKPKLQTLDNKSSAVLKSYFTENDVAFQLVPPHCRIRNTAERAIITFK
jgi:hypothetical protein